MDSVKTSNVLPTTTQHSATLAAENLQATAASPGTPSCNEDSVLAILRRRDLAPEIIEQICANGASMKSRKVRSAIAAHSRTPRRIALRLIREFYTGDLIEFSVSPAVSGDLRRPAAEALIARLPSITLGERISLARRAPTLVAAVLLLDQERKVWQAALGNPRLTEAAVIGALKKPQVSAELVGAVCRHPNWSPRPEVRAALLLNEKTPLDSAEVFCKTLPATQLRDILHVSRSPLDGKSHLEKMFLRAGDR